MLLVPGFGAGDASLEVLARWLRTRGYRTYRSRILANVDLSHRVEARLERRLAHIAAAHGERVAIVGHSRGGVLAAALARSRPDLVAGIVTLGSPAQPGRFPTSVRWISIRSRRDRVVPWRTCRHRAATQIAVDATHLGLVLNADAYLAIARALPTFRFARRPWHERTRRQLGAWGRVAAPV